MRILNSWHRFSRGLWAVLVLDRLDVIVFGVYKQVYQHCSEHL
jgi:hypothetical protein